MAPPIRVILGVYLSFFFLVFESMKSDKHQPLGASENLVISTPPCGLLTFRALETLGFNTIPKPYPALPCPFLPQHRKNLGHD